jgi:predicted permease
MLADIQWSLRSVRRSPAFTATLIGTIALALGLNLAVFSVFNAYVLRPLGLRDPHSLYGFTWRNQAGRFHSFTHTEYEQFKQANHVFSEVFGGHKQLVARIDGQPAYGMLVTDGYFSTLGVQATLGRALMPEDSLPGREAVVVLSHAYWQSRFGSARDVLGRKLVIRGYVCEIIGVLPKGFAGLDLLPHDFWAPLALAPYLEERPRLEIVGRLKPGVTIDAAEAALMAWARAVTSDRSQDEKAAAVLVESRATSIPRSPLTLALSAPILLAFALVMVIACANVANMMLARVVARQREIGIRMSLGASRLRIMRQLLTEAIVLAVPAAAGALLVSQWTLDAGVGLLISSMPAEYADYIRLPPFSPDVRVFMFAIAAMGLSTTLFGLMPALQATRPNLVRAARGEFTDSGSPARPRHALVVIQVAASACLLICAVMLFRTSTRLASMDMGLSTRDVIQIHVREKARSQVLQTLESMPVELAAASTVPLDATPPRVSIAAAGESVFVQAGYQRVSPQFFDVFGIALASGRHFTQQESAGHAPVAIISETSARRLWPNGDAVGQSLQIAANARNGGEAGIATHSVVEIVGVARDVGIGYLKARADRTAIYLPTTVRDSGSGILLRMPGNVEAARAQLDRTLESASPGSIDRINTMQALAVGRVFPLKVAWWISGLLGAVALVLTVSGIYGLLSYLVVQRTKEIGIRMVLGATMSGVVGLVLRHSLRLALVGLLAGTAIALGASKVLAARLLMLDAFDGVAYLSGAAIVLTACVAAAAIPALRAGCVAPMETLRGH